MNRAKELLRLKVSGEDILNYPLLGLMTLSIISTSILTRPEVDSIERFVLVLNANLFAISILGVLIVLLESLRSIRFPDARVPLTVLAVVGFAFGFAKGLLTSFGVWALGAGESQEVLNPLLLLSVGTVGLVMFPLIALFGSLSKRFNEQRDALIETSTAMATERLPYPQLLLTFVEDVSSRLKQKGLQENRQVLAQELRDIISNNLRPLSRRIWERQNKEFPIFSVRKLTETSLKSNVYLPLLVTPIWVLSSVSHAVEFFDIDIAWQVQLVRGATMALVLYLASLIRPRSLGSRVVLYVSSIVSIACLQALLGNLAGGLPAFDWELPLVIGNLIWLFQLTLFAAVAKTFLEMKERYEQGLSELGSPLEADELRKTRELQLQERQLANFLHGTLQNKLSSAANSLEQNTSDSSVAQDLKAIEALLRQALAEYDQNEVSSSSELVKRLTADWAGLIELSFDFKRSDLTNEMAGEVYEVMNEGIANALRHGEASSVTLTLKAEGEIVISDDGIGIKDTTSGLGSAYLDEVSSEWSLQREKGKTVLRVKLKTALV